MKVCVILSDDYKRKLRSLNRYIALPVGMTLFEYYKIYGNGSPTWVLGKMMSEVINTNFDVLLAPQMTAIRFMIDGKFVNYYRGDIVPLLQQVIFKG